MTTIAEGLQEFVRSEAYEHLFETLRGRYLKQFEQSAPSEHAVRQEAYVMLRAIRDLDKEIQKYLSNLKVKR